ncbi:uncharacterized protein LOC143027022 isoform X2 [Oratosquilla oratoria]|uniref:uncharacterized protein LOC143027022 isoform X2 n=1 Tax=Oratosquilla oratoria TaxID=337810 RepID=UPI003F760825
MSTETTEDEQDYEILIQYLSRPECSRPRTAGAPDGWSGPSVAKVDGIEEDVVGCFHTRPKFSPPPHRTAFPVRPPSYADESLSWSPPTEDDVQFFVERGVSSCTPTTRLPTTPCRSTGASTHTQVPVDATPSVNTTLLSKHKSPSSTPDSLVTAFTNLTSLVQTTPSSCGFGAMHISPFLFDTAPPKHTCRSSSRDGDKESDPMVGLLYDPSPKPCNPKSDALSIVSSSTATGDPCITRSSTVNTCPARHNGVVRTWSVETEEEVGKGDSWRAKCDEPKSSAIGKDIPQDSPSTSKSSITNRKVVTPITTDSATGSTKSISVAQLGAIPKNASKDTSNGDVISLTRKLRKAEEKIQEMEAQMERQALQLEDLKGLYEMSKTRVVMDPSVYQQVAQAYISNHRPARRKHGECSTYPGHLVCDLASSNQKGTL